VIRRYDLLHKGAGVNGPRRRSPAEFLIDSSGTIRWINLTGDLRVRARPDQIIQAASPSKWQQTPMWRAAVLPVVAGSGSWQGQFETRNFRTFVDERIDVTTPARGPTTGVAAPRFQETNSRKVSGR